MILFHSINTFNISPKKEYKEWIKALVHSKEKKVGDIHYLFCDDEYLLEINQKFLQHNDYTDIISFDYSEKKIISGDILISVERVKENAKIFKVSFQEELLRVLAHGVLHFMGYKDKKEQEAKTMREEENKAILLFESITKK